MQKFALLLVALLISSPSTAVETNSETATDSCKADPFPSPLIDSSGLFTSGNPSGTGASLIRFQARDGHTLTAYTYRATAFSSQSDPIVFIMHGAARNAIDYLNRFRPIAEQHAALAIAPEFPEAVYGPGSDRYTLAVGRNTPLYTSTYITSQWKNRDDYLYSEIEHLFEAIRQELHSSECTYRIWGHSAGGQFVHRLMTFRPDARVAVAVAVNAGFYTLPSFGNGSDANFFMPYGLQGTPLGENDIRRLLQAPLVILAGELDTETGKESKSIRDSREANFQGSNRRERAELYYRMGEQEAHRLQTPFGWRHAVVPGVGHNARKAGPSAAWFLFHPADENPCVTTPSASAAGLVINEIYGDPAGGSSGDANRDGLRHPQEDEFVELVNTSRQDICLSDWHLGDAANPSRHRFPLGSLLPAGKALVVFGGGVPTGNFGGAEIQTAVASGELNLNNNGDVLVLSDAFGTTHTRLSWGDCAGGACAEGHISPAININQSLTRRPEAGGPFHPHGIIQPGTRFSPGTRSDGTPFDQAFPSHQE